MAKNTRKPAAAPALTTLVALPEALVALLPAFGTALNALTLANHALEGAETDEAKAAAASEVEAANTTAVAAWTAITGWIETDLEARVAAAGVEADRQLAEKRAELQSQLDAVATEIAKVQEQSAGLASNSQNTPQSDGERGAGDTAGPDAGETAAIEVTGPKKGRWRAGIYFDDTPKEVVVNAEQFEKIVADPALTWRAAD